MIIRRGKLVEIKKVDRLVVVGDLHGDYESFSKTKKFLDEETVLVYLGDYADRGDFGMEIIEELSEMMKKYPESVVVLKGNHEQYNDDGSAAFYPCDLRLEVVSKGRSWDEYFENFLRPFFKNLPLCAVYLSEKRLFFVHGGVSSKIESEKDLVEPSPKIEEDLLWSDPFSGLGEFLNPRGAGVLFGKDVTENFCKKFKVSNIVRSHEPKKALYGPVIEHDGKVLTVSSTRVYGGRPHVLMFFNEEVQTFYLD